MSAILPNFYNNNSNNAFQDHAYSNTATLPLSPTSLIQDAFSISTNKHHQDHNNNNNNTFPSEMNNNHSYQLNRNHNNASNNLITEQQQQQQQQQQQTHSLLSTHHYNHPSTPTQSQQLTDNTNPMMIHLPYQYFLDNNNNVNVTPFYQQYYSREQSNNNCPNPPVAAAAALTYQVSQQDFQKQDLPQKLFSDASSHSLGTRGNVEIQQNVPRNIHKSNLNSPIDHGDWQFPATKECEMGSLAYGSILQSAYPSPTNMVSLDGLQTPLSATLPYSQTQPMPFSDELSMQQYDYQFDPNTYSDAQYDPDYQQPPTPTSNSSSRPSSPSLVNQKPPVYTKWTEEEDQLLRAAISIYGPHKWSLIAAHVPNRTPMQCSTRWLGALNPTIHKGRWTPEEDAALKEAVAEYVDLIDSDGNPQPIPWNKIAARIPHRTGIQCQARWSEALDPRVRKGKWSPEEDEILKEGVRRFGRCWIRIAEMIDGRTQRQCRTRWVQIKNKQAKLERDAIAAVTTVAVSNDSNDDDNNSVAMISPPNSTPTTPTMNTLITGQNGVASSFLQTGLRHPVPPPLDLSQINLYQQEQQQEHEQQSHNMQTEISNDVCSLVSEQHSPNSPIDYKFTHSPTTIYPSSSISTSTTTHSPSDTGSIGTPQLSSGLAASSSPTIHVKSIGSIINSQNSSPQQHNTVITDNLALIYPNATANGISSRQHYSYTSIM
ncbi:hypothetical protein G9A89_020449 [Geosiphon pyriformis]|nr:hypothetical protein G9A89_020449 [Geosiphon pyriformis]